MKKYMILNLKLRNWLKSTKELSNDSSFSLKIKDKIRTGEMFKVTTLDIDKVSKENYDSDINIEKMKQ